MQPNDLTASQYRQQLLKGIVNSEEFGARNDGATPISNRRATSDDVTNFPSIDYIFYNLVGTYTITRILGNYGTAKGIAYFIEDKEPLYSKYPCILYREELDVNYHGSSTKVKAFKEYIYSLEQDKIVKYFVNENNNTLFYQMHFISNNPCQVEATHQCNLDIYQASYIFLNEDAFELSYKISGPNKYYTIKTSFIRL